MSVKRVMIALLVMIGTLGCQPHSDTTYLVDWVVDGDTFHVSSLESSIRIADIDAPELHEPDGEDAKWFLIELIYKERVELDCELERDVYDRHLCLVYIDGVSVSDALLDEFASVKEWE